MALHKRGGIPGPQKKVWPHLRGFLAFWQWHGEVFKPKDTNGLKNIQLSRTWSSVLFSLLTFSLCKGRILIPGLLASQGICSFLFISKIPSFPSSCLLASPPSFSLPPPFFFFSLCLLFFFFSQVNNFIFRYALKTLCKLWEHSRHHSSSPETLLCS